MAKKNKKSQNAANNVVLYLRYSTANQNELSIEYQREACKKYCEKQGYIITKEFVDEARTGTNDKRSSFQTMVQEALNAPSWTKIIVFTFSRFARNTALNGYYEILLGEECITVESATEDNSQTPEARLMRNVYASFDGYMPEKCAVHTHASLKTKARKGLHCGGTPPLGYDVVDERLVVNPYEAETVKMIFEMYDKNYSYADMIKVLTDKGRTTKRGVPFQKTSFNSILQNEKYKGIFFWNKAVGKSIDDTHNSHAYKPIEEQVRIDDGCDAIIDKDLFDRVQEKMRGNRKRNMRSAGKNHYMLGGMGKVYCAGCGASMVGAAYKSHGISYRYYACPNHKLKTCNTKNLRADYLENMVSLNIAKYAIRAKNYQAYNQLFEEIAGAQSKVGIKKELSGVKKAIENLLKTIETHPTDEAAERLEVLSAKKANLQKQLAAATNAPSIKRENLVHIKQQLSKELRKSPDPLIYDIINSVVDKITVSNESVEVILNI